MSSSVGRCNLCLANAPPGLGTMAQPGKNSCSLRSTTTEKDHRSPRCAGGGGHLGGGQLADPSRGVLRICHTCKVRKQDILAKESIKGCAGRRLFSRHWRAQLCLNLPKPRPGIPGLPCSTHVASGPDEVVSKPNGALTTALFPHKVPRTLATANRSHDADKRDEPDLAYGPDHPSGAPLSPGTRCDHPRGLITVEWTQAARQTGQGS